MPTRRVYMAPPLCDSCPRGPGGALIARKQVPLRGEWVYITTERRTKIRVNDEIKRMQSSTELLIPKKPFQLLVREVLQKTSQENMRITQEAMDALQEAAESHVTEMLEAAQKVATKGKRVTIKPEDIQLVKELREQK